MTGSNKVCVIKGVIRAKNTNAGIVIYKGEVYAAFDQTRFAVPIDQIRQRETFNFRWVF